MAALIDETRKLRARIEAASVVQAEKLEAVEAAAATARVRRQRLQPSPSSGLRWHHDHGSLDNVLVPVD